MADHSILIPIHDLGDGMFARVIRVLRGTRTSSWSGTLAYKTGLDVLVTVHCISCCCLYVRDPATCGAPREREMRVEYQVSDRDAWFRRAVASAEKHRRERH